MKKVLILFGKSRWEKSRPFSNEKYMYSYEYFYGLCKEKGVQVYRASYQWYDHEKKIFKYAWIFEGKNAKWKRVKKVGPDLVYDKTKATAEAYYQKEKIAENYHFFNDLQFTKLIDNKLYMSLLFSEWSKKSWLVNNLKELKKALKIVKTEKIVLKPLEQSGGKGIIIEEKGKILEWIKKEKHNLKSSLAQEFIDTSKGIPGVMKGVHDLRLVFVGDELAYAYYRKPANGKLLANLAQGGSMEIVSLKNLPKETRPIIKVAQDLFSSFQSKVYTVDLMFDEKGNPWVVELNSMPGMYFTEKQEETRKQFYQKLLLALKNELKTEHKNA